MADKSLSSSAAAGVSYLILVQLLSRGLTFALNQVLLRFLSPEILGLSAQLELYSISVLYFSRENIRVAVQRQASGVQKVVNLAYVAILAGVPLSYIGARIHLRAEVPRVAFFDQSLIVYGVACTLELLSEPAFVAAQQKLLYKVRASAETAAAIARCLSTCGTAMWASRSGIDVGVLPFAVGQAAYAIVLLIVYVVRVESALVGSESFALLPARISAEKNEEPSYLSLFSRPLTRLSISLTLQSTLKYILTQADALLITALASLADQGAYALASNYGGLIARMVFQPIEESSRNLFAKLCASRPPFPRAATDAKKAQGKQDVVDAQTPETTKDPSQVRLAAQILTTVLHLYGLLSLFALSLGPHLAPLLLRVVAGSKWADTSASQTLSTYCYYIPLLALNGIIEAFVSAVAGSSELYTQALFMGFFSVGFAAAAWLFLGVWEMGAQGLVWANCVNMGMRIVWGWGFVARWFERREVAFEFIDALPSAMSAAAAVAAHALLRSPVGPSASDAILAQLMRGGGTASMLAVCILFFERDFFVKSYQMLKPKPPT